MIKLNNTASVLSTEQLNSLPELDRLPLTALPKSLHEKAPRCGYYTSAEGALVKRYCIANAPRCKHAKLEPKQRMGGQSSTGYTQGALECHELFDYRVESDGVHAKFTGVAVLCPMCHQTQHVGRLYLVESHEYCKQLRIKYCEDYGITEEQGSDEHTKAQIDHQRTKPLPLVECDYSEADKLLEAAKEGQALIDFDNDCRNF